MMPRLRNPNLEMLEMAVERLGSLVEQVVFVGGCATGLLLTDAAAPPIRMTQDVDVIAELVSLADYHRFSVRLRQQGFREDQSPEAPICRWRANELVLDVMPANPSILGFGNEWYAHAVETALPVVLPSGCSIRMISAPCFLATKLAAFSGRGAGDYVMSHDLEDVVAVLDGRAEIVDEVGWASSALRAHLVRRFSELLAAPGFLDALPGHLPGDAVSQERLPILEDRIRRLAQLTG